MNEIFKITIITYGFWVCTEPGMIFEWYAKLIDRLPEWLYKPLGGCYKCFTGQVLFWYYLILHIENYSIIDQLFYPAAGILLTSIYDYIYEKIRL